MKIENDLARRLRHEQTPPERRFWALIRPWRDAGWHWRRQAPVGCRSVSPFH
jgi:very-short-patch-repair endonuclease